MNQAFPQRSAAHVLEEYSWRYLLACLPPHWTVDRPGTDYGVDARIDLFNQEHATGVELLVQLKSSDRSSAHPMESVRLKTSTFNMLANKLQVVMLVKYCRDVNEAYWLLLRDARRPKNSAASITVQIPKVNLLSTIDWNGIQDLLIDVHRQKLHANLR